MLNLLILSATTLYQAIAILLENRQPPPGQLIDVGGYRLHLYTMDQSVDQSVDQSIDQNIDQNMDQSIGESNTTKITFIIDHSLGGIEGYVLIEELAKLGRVCLYDRAGYGWSNHSPHRRTSDQIVTELDTLLTQANIAPPYILIGNSFGSYNARLYAHRFPEKVKGLVLTDGLHEKGMLNMPLPVTIFKYSITFGLAWLGFWSAFGTVRLFKALYAFELLKPDLRKVPPDALYALKRSFCRPKHWITMTREIWNIDASGRQLRAANNLGNLPIITIKASSFFLPALWTLFLPIRSINRLRDQIHEELLKLSSQSELKLASRSGHFVWIDQPDVIIDAAKIVLQRSPDQHNL